MGDDGADLGGGPTLPATCDVASPRSDLELKSCQVAIDSYCFLGKLMQDTSVLQIVVITFNFPFKM